MYTAGCGYLRIIFSVKGHWEPNVVVDAGNYENWTISVIYVLLGGIRA